jgi:hypothetical protein
MTAFLSLMSSDMVTMFGTDARVRAVKKACSNVAFTEDDRTLAEAIAQSKPAAMVLPLLTRFFDRLAPFPRHEPRDTRLGSDSDEARAANDDPVAESLYRAWESKFFGSSLHDLRTFVDTYNGLEEKEIYAKTVVFVQSSGMGKSRLADEYGRTVCPMIGYCLRRESKWQQLSRDVNHSF